MRISRIFLVPILIVILAAFAFVRMAEAKWPTPASSAAKNNPIAPKQACLGAGQKM
jgi:hypothetical protein